MLLVAKYGIILSQGRYSLSKIKDSNKLKAYDFGTYEVTKFEVVLKDYSSSLDTLEVYAFIPMSMNGGSNPSGDNSMSTMANDN